MKVDRFRSAALLTMVAVQGRDDTGDLIPPVTRAGEYRHLVQEHGYARASIVDVGPDGAVMTAQAVAAEQRTGGMVLVVGAVPHRVRAAIEMCTLRGDGAVLFEDDLVAVIVAARAATVAAHHVGDIGRARVVVRAPAVCPAVPALLVALGVQEVTPWEALSESVRQGSLRMLFDADVVVDLSRRSSTVDTEFSRVVEYPRGVVRFCGPLLPPLVGAVCDEGAPSVPFEVLAALVRMLVSVNYPAPTPASDDFAILVASCVDRALKSRP